MKKISRRQFLATSAIATLYGSTNSSLVFADNHSGEVSTSLPWSNWSGGVSCQPRQRVSPVDEAALVRYLSSSSGPVRPVGSGHSFTPLVPTDGDILVADQLTGLISHDPQKLTATFAAGTRLSDMGILLDQIGQAPINLPDIDRQTLAGAISTATHGTGKDFQCLSGYVTGMRLVTPSGEVLDITPDDEALFNAARVSIGSLGVITQVTMQNREKYRLKQKNWVSKTDEVLRDFDSYAAKYRHFEILPLTHSDYSLVVATEETTDAINNPPASPEEEAAFSAMMREWMKVAPENRRPLINGLAEFIQPTEAVDESFKMLTNVRSARFNEMEYSLPFEAGAECLQEILKTIADKKADVVMPLEYRYVARDDTWLSMSSGHEDHVALSVHRTASEDYRPYFDLIEPIFWKYGGRPHWGKIHTLGESELSKLYPNFKQFQAIRKKLDPKGRMLNSHLRNIFGE